LETTAHNREAQARDRPIGLAFISTPAPGGWLDRFCCRLLEDLTVEMGWCLGPLGAARTHPPAELSPSPAQVYRAFGSIDIIVNHPRR